MPIEQAWKELRESQRKARLSAYLAGRGEDIIASSPAPKLKEEKELENNQPVKTTPRDSWLETHPLDILGHMRR